MRWDRAQSLDPPTALPTDEQGYIRCTDDLRVAGFANVWAAGDCAINVGPDGRQYPFTAQHALREGVQLAKNLMKVMRGQAPEPCRIRSRGSLAMIGYRTGVAKILGMKFSGPIAWFLYRTIYLFKMPGVLRKLRIAVLVTGSGSESANPDLACHSSMIAQ